MSQKIHILGDGVTAKSVREALPYIEAVEVPIDDADLIVASPGIPPTNYPNSAVPIVSDIELAYLEWQKQATKPIIVAVTGTNGKSTVTALSAHLLNAPAVGNIGTAVMTYFKETNESPFVVIETSSYQLESCRQFKPDIAVLLNISEDHLERHKSMENYAKAKSNITKNQTKKERFFYDAEDEWCVRIATNTNATCHAIDTTTIDPALLSHFPFNGGHHDTNAAVAIMIAQTLGIKDADIAARLETFNALPHRMEDVPYKAGIRVINDSKATNPHSTETAIQSLRPATIRLILCGYDKGLNLNALLEEIEKNVETVIVFGDIKERFLQEINAKKARTTLFPCHTLDDAWKIATDISQKGDTILFSPACSSFDQFDNFEHRGDQFKALVLESNYG